MGAMSQDYRRAAHLPLSWTDIHRDCLVLADRLRPAGPFVGIVAIARGGLVPAAILANVLDIRLIETVCVSSYAGRRQGEVEVLRRLDGDGAGWLVVEDLVDSGATLQAVRAMLPHAHTAVLYAKPEGRAMVDTFAAEIDQDVWLVFPWENE